MITVYGDRRSGNCYKVGLLLAHLKQDYHWQHVDVLAGDTQTAAFLELNPNGKIPVVLLDNRQTLSESNAILNFLAEENTLLPQAGIERARVLQWMFFEQYSHEPCIAVARFIKFYQNMPESRMAEYQSKLDAGYKVLGLMEQHLESTAYFANDRFSIADIALYAYTHVAEEGGFDLRAYPAIKHWLSRVAEQPLHRQMADV